MTEFDFEPEKYYRGNVMETFFNNLCTVECLYKVDRGYSTRILNASNFPIKRKLNLRTNEEKFKSGFKILELKISGEILSNIFFDNSFSF